MIENWFFVLGIVAVLLIPGPTNAMLASSAHHQGTAKTLSCVPAEWLGYLYAIALWSLFIHLTQPIWPALVPILHAVSAIYVVWLAFGLWKSTYLEKYSQNNLIIRPKQIFFSTLKNPKPLLFAVGIFPEETWSSAQNTIIVLGIFSLVLFPMAGLWVFFGRILLSNQVKSIRADLIYKGSALLLIICMLPVIFGYF